MYNIKQINTGVAELLAVKVPEGAVQWWLNNQSLMCYKADNFFTDEIGLPEGDWTPLGLSTELTEEQCREVMPIQEGGNYLDYVLFRGHLQNYVDTAKEAFASLMQANGCYSVNPNGKEEPKHQKGIKYLERLKWRWQQAEENTGTWIVLKRLS